MDVKNKTTHRKSWAVTLQSAVLRNKDPLYPPRDALQRNSKIITFPTIPTCWIWKGNPVQDQDCVFFSYFCILSFAFSKKWSQVKPCDQVESPALSGLHQGSRSRTTRLRGAVNWGSLRETRPGFLEDSRPDLCLTWVSVHACVRGRGYIIKRN